VKFATGLPPDGAVQPGSMRRAKMKHRAIPHANHFIVVAFYYRRFRSDPTPALNQFPLPNGLPIVRRAGDRDSGSAFNSLRISADAFRGRRRHLRDNLVLTPSRLAAIAQ